MAIPAIPGLKQQIAVTRLRYGHRRDAAVWGGRVICGVYRKIRSHGRREPALAVLPAFLYMACAITLLTGCVTLIAVFHSASAFIATLAVGATALLGLLRDPGLTHLPALVLRAFMHTSSLTVAIMIAPPTVISGISSGGRPGRPRPGYGQSTR